MKIVPTVTSSRNQMPSAILLCLVPGLCLEIFLSCTVNWAPVSMKVVKCLVCVSSWLIREVPREGTSSGNCWVPRAGVLAAPLRDEGMGSRILLLGLENSKGRWHLPSLGFVGHGWQSLEVPSGPEQRLLTCFWALQRLNHEGP